MLVVFRKFPDGGVIALFPLERMRPWAPEFDASEFFRTGRQGYIESYMHVGQHGEACYELVRELPGATIKEYAPLLQELKSIGYTDLKIV